MNIENLKKVIQKANPEIMIRSGSIGISDRPIMTQGRPIRLADVLLAIQKLKLNYAFLVDQEGGFVTCLPGGNPKLFSVLKGWNLSDDNFDNQSDECLEFLTKLLCE